MFPDTVQPIMLDGASDILLSRHKTCRYVAYDNNPPKYDNFRPLVWWFYWQRWNWTNLNSNSSHLVISFRVHHLMAEVVVERLIMRTTIEAVLRTYTLTLYVTLTCWCPVNGYYPLSLDWIEDYLRYYYNYWRFFWGGAWRSIPDVMTTDPTVAETSHSESQMAVCGVTKGKISKFIRIPPSVQTWN